jgi:hypothetical protein
VDLKIRKLVLLCRQGEEQVLFSEKLSFFHGEMSTGKSTIVEMINYCFGATLVRTPAVTSEVIGVQILLVAGKTEALLERSISANQSVSITWRRDTEVRLDSLPLKAGNEPILEPDVYNLSDFLLRALGVPLLKVRRSKVDDDSEMQRVGFRDFYKFVYLDQDDLDSSFFLLETPIRQEKSKDVLRYVLGLHSDQLSELEVALSELKQRQRSIREVATQIDKFLTQYGLGSESEIASELKLMEEKSESVEQTLKSLTPANVPTSFVSEELQTELMRLSSQVREKEAATREVEEQLRDQQSLAAELTSLKLKLVRASSATTILGGASFHSCPACGSQLAKPTVEHNCILCHSDTRMVPKAAELDSAVVHRDLIDRIDDLDRSVKRLKRSLERHGHELRELLQTRGALQRRADTARSSGESQYMQRVRQLEAERGGLEERRRFLKKVVAMPAEIEARRREADRMAEQIANVERQISKEQEKFEAGRQNVASVEQNFHQILLAIHFPAIKPTDAVHLNTKTWLPYVHPNANADRAWTFADAGSGGKKVLFKICFALALHLTAAQRNLSLPRLLIVDSTMKNITPDINPDVVRHFYKELYCLLANELKDWQCILVDQSLVRPDRMLDIKFAERKLKKDDPSDPPLISYYAGH